MKFLVRNYSCLQNPRLGGYRSQIPVLPVLRPQLNLLNTPPPTNKIPGYATDQLHSPLATKNPTNTLETCLYFVALITASLNTVRHRTVTVVH